MRKKTNHYLNIFVYKEHNYKGLSSPVYQYSYFYNGRWDSITYFDYPRQALAKAIKAYKDVSGVYPEKI